MQLRHSALYLLAQGIPALAAFFTLALYTRWLSPEDYGMYSTLLIIANSANIILFNWMYVALMRYWNTTDFQKDELISLVGVVLVIGSALIVGGAIVYFVITQDALVAVIIAILMIANAIYMGYQRINSISLQAERYLLIELARVILTTLLAVGLVWSGYSWYGILLATSLGFLLIPVVSSDFWRRFWHYPKNLNYQKIFKLLQYGLPLSIVFMLLELIHVTDRVLLSWLIGFEAAGQYAVAFSLPFQLLILVASAINMAAYPLILQALEQHGEAAAKSKLADYLLILIGLLLPSYFGLIAVSHDFMPLLIGINYLNDSLRLLPAIGFLLLINAIYLFYISLAFQIAKQTQKTIWIVGFATVLNIILNFILIPYYQIEGAIIASLVAYLFCVVYGYMVSMKYFKMPILWWELLKLIFAASLMLILLNYLPIDTGLIEGFIRIVVGLCFYLAMIWLLNVGKVRLFLACFLKTMNKQNESTHYQA